jgi:hypothetical protein
MGPAQQIGLGAHGVGLGGRGEKAAEGDIVGPCCLSGECQLQAVVAGDPNDGPGPEQAAGLRRVAVVAAQVDPVGVDGGGQRRVVVDDQPCPRRTAQVAQGLGLGTASCQVAGLVTVLDDPSTAGDGQLHAPGQVRARVVWGNGVEAAQLVHGRSVIEWGLWSSASRAKRRLGVSWQ